MKVTVDFDPDYDDKTQQRVYDEITLRHLKEMEFDVWMSYVEFIHKEMPEDNFTITYEDIAKKIIKFDQSGSFQEVSSIAIQNFIEAAELLKDYLKVKGTSKARK